jgi:succinoglycan biosynthesis transport protein ExoP
MTPQRLLSALIARWRVALATLAAALVLALAITALQPRLYTATAMVLLDTQTPDSLSGTTQVQPLQAGAYVAAQVEVILSERVLRRVIESEKLATGTGSETHERWLSATSGEGDYVAWLAEQMRKRLEVRPGKESGVITIAYSATDRARAARVANAVTRAYIDTSLEMRVEPARQHQGLFAAQADALRERLEQAQARLSEYQRTHGLVAVGQDERLDIETARLNELSSQVVQLQSLAGESDNRQRLARANSERAPDVLNHPSIAALAAEVARQETKLSELRTRLGEQHPSIVELQANIRQLRAQQTAETARVQDSLGINDSVNQGRIAQMRAQLEAQRARVLALKAQRDEAAVLQRDVQNNQAAYDAIATRGAQAALESRRNLTNISVLKVATPPALPTSPKLMVNLTVALILGAALAVAAVIAREQKDRRLRNAEDVPETLGLPLLVEIPRVARAAQDRRLSFSLAGLRTPRS